MDLERKAIQRIGIGADGQANIEGTELQGKAIQRIQRITQSWSNDLKQQQQKKELIWVDACAEGLSDESD